VARLLQWAGGATTEDKAMRWFTRKRWDPEELRAAEDWVRAALALDTGDPTETTLRLCARLQETLALSPGEAVELVLGIAREVEAARGGPKPGGKPRML